LWVAGSHDSADNRELAAIHMLGVCAFYKIQQLSHPEGSAKPTLSRREREVLTWVATGKTAWEIGEVLHISKRTVEWHLQHAAQKLGASNRMHAVIIAARDHLIEI
jgi:LuxR family quorum sensing-dependent transcriptional regulator